MTDFSSRIHFEDYLTSNPYRTKDLFYNDLRWNYRLSFNDVNDFFDDDWFRLPNNRLFNY